MNDRHDRLNRHVDDLLTDRSPRPFVPDDDEERAVLRMAARLRSLQPGADLPRHRFSQTLSARLVQSINPRRTLSRRGVLLGALGGMVAGMLVGIGVVANLGAVVRTALTRQPALELAGWTLAGSIRSLPSGGALMFTTPQLSGYVLRQGDRLSAMSSICNHMGCRVDWASTTNQFVCACDGAQFAATGEHISDEYSYATPVRPLTRLAVQRRGDQLYVRPV